MLRVLVAMSCVLVACDETAGGRAGDILALSGDVANGRTLYTTTCQSCHAADGSGVEDLGINIQDVDIDVVVDAVLNGRTNMAAYGEVFEDQEIADIAAFAESF